MLVSTSGPVFCVVVVVLPIKIVCVLSSVLRCTYCILHLKSNLNQLYFFCEWMNELKFCR